MGVVEMIEINRSEDALYYATAIREKRLSAKELVLQAIMKI